MTARSHASNPGTLSPDDRAFSRVIQQQVETPYLSHGVGVTPDDRGFARVGPQGDHDDRCHRRRKSLRRQPVPR